MADLATVLTEAQGALAALQAAAGAAAAGGSAQQQTQEAAWQAIAAVEAATAQAQGHEARLAAGDDTLAAALAARNATLDQYETERTEGDEPPLADATATELRDAVAAASGVTGTQVDGELTTAVTDQDATVAAIAGPLDTAVTGHAAAVLDLAAKQVAFDEKSAAADSALAAAGAAPTLLAEALTRALVERESALVRLDDGDANGAAVDYVDYVAARATLAAAAADAAGAALTTAWATARDEALAALGDLLVAQVTLAEAEQALAARQGERGVAEATRDQAAAVEVATAVDGILNP